MKINSIELKRKLIQLNFEKDVTYLNLLPYLLNSHFFKIKNSFIYFKKPNEIERMHLKAYNDLRFTKIVRFFFLFIFFIFYASSTLFRRNLYKVKLTNFRCKLGVGGLIAKLCLTLSNPWTVAC